MFMSASGKLVDPLVVIADLPSLLAMEFSCLLSALSWLK
jgi:hypothetical protein